VVGLHGVDRRGVGGDVSGTGGCTGMTDAAHWGGVRERHWRVHGHDGHGALGRRASHDDGDGELDGIVTGCQTLRSAECMTRTATGW
jgi:hypothetical protein